MRRFIGALLAVAAITAACGHSVELGPVAGENGADASTEGGKSSGSVTGTGSVTVDGGADASDGGTNVVHPGHECSRSTDCEEGGCLRGACVPSTECDVTTLNPSGEACAKPCCDDAVCVPTFGCQPCLITGSQCGAGGTPCCGQCDNGSCIAK
jgi:hypothetical protein